MRNVSQNLKENQVQEMCKMSDALIVDRIMDSNDFDSSDCCPVNPDVWIWGGKVRR